MSSKQLKPWGRTADGFLVFTIKSKQYFLKNNKFFNIGDGKEANSLIQTLVHRTIVKEVLKSTPDLLKKTNDEIKSFVIEVLKRKTQVDVADKNWNIALSAKKIAQKMRVLVAAKKLRNLARKRVSVDVEKNTTRHIRTDEPLYPLNPAYDLPRNAEHPFGELSRN
jgi:hypothetical protein